MERFNRFTRRDFLKYAAMATTGATLAACAPAPQGGESTGSTSPESGQEQATGEKVTITYLVRTDIGAKILEWNDKAVQDFEAKNPDIKVEVVGVPWGDYNAKLLAMFAAGTPPEVSANYAAGFATFYANGAITPLDDLIAAYNVDVSPIEQAARDAVTREGKLWALPLAHMPTIVFYNKQLFDEAGLDPLPTDVTDTSWTTDKMFQVATNLAHDVGDPRSAVWGMVFGTGQLGTYSWLWGVDPFNNQGGPELTEAYQTGIVTEVYYDTPTQIDFMQWLVDLTYKHQVAPRPSDTDAISQTVGWPMMSGRIGMYVNGAWAFTNFADVQPEWAWSVAPLPYGPAGKNTSPLYNDSWMLSAGARHPEEGFRFLKYLALEEGARLYAEITGFFPANKNNYDIFYDSVLEIPNIAATREELQQVFDGSFQVGYVTPGKTLDGYPELNQAYTQTTAPILNNETSVPEGMKAVQEKFESIIATKL